MARAALNWTAQELAVNANVGISTVNRFETGQVAPIPATLAAIRTALEAAGVEFIDGGVKLRGSPEHGADLTLTDPAGTRTSFQAKSRRKVE